MKYLDKYPNCVGCPVKKWCGTMISCIRLCKSYQENKTEMNYEEKYNQALERAKYLKENTDSVGAKDISYNFEYIFPELKENGDEKIKKALIEHFAGAHSSMYPYKGFTKEQILAWLEKQGEKNTIVNESPSKEMILAVWELGNIWKELTKGSSCTEYGTQLQYIQKHWNESNYYEKLQGEQNPTDKVEPKFKNGQWIVWQNKCYKVNYNGCGYELIDQNGLSTSLEYVTVDENAHLWTIQDAKKGDVLVCDVDKRPFIFEGLLDSNHHNCPVAYCGIDDEDYFSVSSGINLWTNDSVKPATQKQHDLLFQKMKEAGYEWDAEKKELKKIEQKPAWSEENEEKFRDVIRLVEQGAPVQSMRDYYTNWLKSIKDRITWKPSEEQMEALLYALGKGGTYNHEALTQLYNNLKTL